MNSIDINDILNTFNDNIPNDNDLFINLPKRNPKCVVKSNIPSNISSNIPSNVRPNTSKFSNPIDPVASASSTDIMVDNIFDRSQLEAMNHLLDNINKPKNINKKITNDNIDQVKLIKNKANNIDNEVDNDITTNDTIVANDKNIDIDTDTDTDTYASKYLTKIFGYSIPTNTLYFIIVLVVIAIILFFLTADKKKDTDDNKKEKKEQDE